MLVKVATCSKLPMHNIGNLFTPYPYMHGNRRLDSDSLSHKTSYCKISQSLEASRFLAATKQLNEWFSPSVCLSVCLSVRPSVRHTFLTIFPSSYHHEIFRSYYQWQKWRPYKRSRSEVKGQGHRGHNPTEPFPDCNSSLNSHMTMKWCI